ncbi:MAG: hypothetical protein ACRD0Q_04565 [Acidimicrobiales bacterium]
MGRGVAEHVVRSRPWGPRRRVRVDLHGISLFGPRSEHSLIRWEWIESIAVEAGVVVRSEADAITLPPGAFGLEPADLAARLETARSIVHRADVIGELVEGADPGR